MNRRLSRDERGVSNVIALVLAFGLFVTLMAVVSVEFVPIWEKDREAEHMLRVQGDFLALHAETERLGDSEGRNGIVALTLGVPKGGLRTLSGAGEPGHLIFAPRHSEAVVCTAQTLRVFAENGRTLVGVAEQWVPVESGLGIPDVVRVDHLRLRVDSPASASSGSAITLTVHDQSGAYAGDARITLEKSGAGFTVKLAVREASGVTLYERGVSYLAHEAPAHHWVDILASETQFLNLLAATRGPTTLVWTAAGLSSAYTITHSAMTTAGVVQLGASGRLEQDWSFSEASGSLTYTSPYQRLPQQRLTYEHGAVILEQPDGAVFIAAPAFEARATGAGAQLHFTIFTLSGAHMDASHAGVLPVSLTTLAERSLQATTPSFEVELPTAYPGLWAAHWRSQLDGAGLSESAGHYEIHTGPGHVRLAVHGAATDPEAHDVLLSLRVVAMRVTVDG